MTQPTHDRPSRTRPSQTGNEPTTAAAVSPDRHSAPPLPLKDAIIDEWVLDPSIAFLNHGCFGARPRTVARAQQQWRDRIEARPIEWLDRKRDELLAEAKAHVGRFIGAQPENFGFVTNATCGVNTVLRSLQFEPGDEMLTISHVYNAVRMTMRYLARRAGAQSIEANVPFPVAGASEILSAVERHISTRTKLLIIDHITSPTALLLPIEQLLELCEARGVDVLIDGAHAPGMIDLHIESIGGRGPAYYTGNLHKWGCAPMGTAFLWVRTDKQADIHPTTISHFLDQSLAAEFSWQGTRDISGWLSAPVAIQYFEQFGLERVREHNHRLAVWAQRMLCEAWGVQPTSPIDGSMLGSMATLPLPPGVRERFETPQRLQAKLYDEFHIEVPIIDFAESWWVRVSCQVYNIAEHYERLAEAMLVCCR